MVRFQTFLIIFILTVAAKDFPFGLPIKSTSTSSSLRVSAELWMEPIHPEEVHINHEQSVDPQQ